ncbi:MAG: hypothetical protein AAF438_10860 [Pseudomonadota bacterium]
MQKLPVLIGLFVGLFGLMGCTPIKSKVGIKPDSINAGIAYFLPQRDLAIRYRTQLDDQQCHESLEITTSEPYADPSAMYMAQISPIFMGDNGSKLVVTPEGLLHSAVSETNPAFREILLSASTSITEMVNRRIAMDRDPLDSDECVARDFSWTVSLPMDAKDLGNHLSVESTDEGYVFRFQQSWTRWSFTLERPGIAAIGSTQSEQRAVDGLLYRVNIPYKISFDSELATRLDSNGAVVFLPNESPILLAPTPGSVFGKKVASITFDQGILVSYEADFEGGGKQVAKLPVEVLGAITAATGNVFRGRKDESEQEYAALQAELRLERLQRQQAACREALNGQDSSKIESDCNF